MVFRGGRINSPKALPSSLASNIAIVKMAKAKTTFQNLPIGCFFLKYRASPRKTPVRVE